MKAILLSRVSTHSQDLTQQTNELYNAAHRDGFTDDNIIVIEDKESAIKLSEEERNGLNELKKNINEDHSITHVYVFEVSRIARKERVLYSIRDFLVEKQVQLIVLNPYMELLDKDNKMTQGAQIMFAMYCAFAESEMTVKKERFQRGKRKKASEGYYIGGPLLFGYTIDKNKKLVINEEQANVVRKMFSLCIQGNTMSKIAKNIFYSGDMDALKWRDIYNYVFRILTRHEYYGGHGKTQNVCYPPIINKTIFDNAQKVLRTKKKPHSQVKHIYYSHKLLRSKIDNRCFVPTHGTITYTYFGEVTFKDNQEMNVPRISINMNFIDSILWHYTKQYRIKNSSLDVKELLKQINEKIVKLERAIKKGEKDIKTFKTFIDKTNERIITNKISEQKGDELIAKYENDIYEISERIEHDVTKMMNLISERTSLLYARPIQQTAIEKVVDEQERYDIIHDTIKVVWVEKLGRSHNKYEIEFTDGTKTRFISKPSIYNRIFLENGDEVYFEKMTRFTKTSLKKAS